MAESAYIKKLRPRAQQLYSQGLTPAKIAGRFLITLHVVSRMLKLKKNAGLQQSHIEHRDLDKKLASGSSQPLLSNRVNELYALGLNIEDLSLLLAVSLPDVFMTIDGGDAELERQHAAHVALDRELIAEKPPLPARRRDGSAYGRGKPTPNGAATAGEDAEKRSAAARPPKAEAQPAQPAEPPAKPAAAPPGPAEQPKVQPAAPGRPATQPAARRASPAAPADRPQRPSTTPPAQPKIRERVNELADAETAAAERKAAEATQKVQLVIKHVRAYQAPLRVYEAPVNYPYLNGRPLRGFEPEEVRQVAIHIAKRVTDLSDSELSEIFDCDTITIARAELPYSDELHTRLQRIEAQVREGAPPPTPQPDPIGGREFIAAPTGGNWTW